MRDLILLHGALETSAVMKPLQEKLAGLFRCHLLPLSGHAHGKFPEHFRIETFVDELDEYLRRHQLKNVTAVGHSMGGYIALSHAAHVEDSPLSRVVCYGTKFDWSEATVAGMLAHLHPENEALMEHMKTVFGEEASRLLAATTHMMSHLARLDGLTPQELAGVQIPVDLVVGDRDKVVTYQESELTARLLPHGQVHVLKDSRHEMERCDLSQLVTLIAGQ